MMERKTYEDNFSCSFRDLSRFLEFLKERKENSEWFTAPSRSLQFQSIKRDSGLGNLYMQIYQDNGKADILADTMDNTSILLNVNGCDYPVRSCALKTILERARISGYALSKVSTEVFTQILNYCLDVATGDSLIKVADEKVSAVHGGDPNDYAILEMLPLFQRVKDYLDVSFPGNTFMTANFDHSIVTAIWSLDGQTNDLLDTYRREIAAKGLIGKSNVRPGLRFTTSDVGMSGANLFPVLLIGNGSRIVPLGYAIKTNHKNKADMEYFDEQLSLLYARFMEAIEKQTKLLNIDIRYPANALLGVLKRVGAPKKASYEALDQFQAQNGEKPCTAYELYLAMSEVIFIAQCEGASGSRIAQLEEIIARALHVNWSEYDRPGAFAW
jgi:hypothetical protein